MILTFLLFILYHNNISNSIHIIANITNAILADLPINVSDAIQNKEYRARENDHNNEKMHPNNKEEKPKTDVISTVFARRYNIRI